MGFMADNTLVLVGNSQGGTISALSVEGDRLQLLASSNVGEGCSTFAIDTGRDLVHCAVKTPTPAIVTLRLDRQSGALTEVSRREVDDVLAYLWLTREGTVLLGASYHGGWGGSWPVADGLVGEQASRIDHANMHCVITDRAGEHGYFASLGDDLVAQVSVTADARMEPLDPPVVEAPMGCGPRHLVMSEDELNVYRLTEFTGEAIRFDRDPQTGVLTMAEAVPGHDTHRDLIVSRYGADPKAEHLIWGADLHLLDEGRLLACSERTESTLTTIALDDSGRLERVVADSDTETQPRGFAVAPDGRQVVVAGEASGTVGLYRLTEANGFELLDRVESGEGPNWVRFV